MGRASRRNSPTKLGLIWRTLAHKLPRALTKRKFAGGEIEINCCLLLRTTTTTTMKWIPKHPKEQQQQRQDKTKDCPQKQWLAQLTARWRGSCRRCRRRCQIFVEKPKRCDLVQPCRLTSGSAIPADRRLVVVHSFVRLSAWQRENGWRLAFLATSQPTRRNKLMLPYRRPNNASCTRRISARLDTTDCDICARARARKR